MENRNPLSPAKLIAALTLTLTVMSTTASSPSASGAARQGAGGVESSVEIALGQSAKVPGTPLTIEVTSIDDSRCPEDVLCYWAGEAKVRLDVVGAAKSPLALEVVVPGGWNPDFDYRGNIVKAGKYHIRGIALTPRPNTGTGAKGERVTLTVRDQPFRLLDASKEPSRADRRQIGTPFGKPAWVKSDQSLWIEMPKKGSATFVEVALRFSVIHANPNGSTQLTGTLDWVSANGRPGPLVVIDHPFGSTEPLRVSANGYTVEIRKVRSFVEDPRKGLNRPSEIGYEALAVVTKS